MKLFKSLLVCCMCFTLVACGQGNTKSSEKVDNILEKEGYQINRMDGLGRDDYPDSIRSIYLRSEDNKGMIGASFNEDKKLVDAFYSEEASVYTIIEGKDDGKSSEGAKDKYNEWLEKLDISHEELMNYLTDMNKTVRDANEIYEIIKDCDFEGENDTIKGDWDHTINLTSNNYTFGICYKNKKVGKFILSSTMATRDGLFVWENGKVTDDTGYNNYFFFLYTYNITHEEFMGYLESLYEINFEE